MGRRERLGLSLASLALAACTAKVGAGPKAPLPIALVAKPGSGLSPEGRGLAPLAGPALAVGPTIPQALPSAAAPVIASPSEAKGQPLALVLEGIVLVPAGIISNHGGGVLSNHGAQRRTLTQSPPSEAPLADTWVGVQDEQGRPVPGLTARTGPDGRFRLSAEDLSATRSYLVVALGSQGPQAVALRALGRPGRPMQLRWASELATLAVAERVASNSAWAAVPVERFEALVLGFQEALEQSPPPLSPASGWKAWALGWLEGQGDLGAKLQQLTEELKADTDRELAKAKVELDAALDRAASEAAEAQRQAEEELKKALGGLKLP